MIITPKLSSVIGENIQGPSVIKSPTWLHNKLGKYLLYFADHKGNNIKLAHSDDLFGPWKIYEKGTLKLSESLFLNEKPTIPYDYENIKLGSMNNPSGYEPHPDQVSAIPDRLDDMTIPHIASPDVHIDNKNREIIMYYHGLEKFGFQLTRVATSKDGINFVAYKNIVARPYFRRFEYKNKFYGISMPGVFYEEVDSIDNFKEIKTLFDGNMRHSSVLVIEDTLYVFFTKVGDIPEKILFSKINLSQKSDKWAPSEPKEVTRPEFDWEGANLPLQKSARSSINMPVNQLRDPFIFKEKENVYMFYAVKGESGIAISKLIFS